MATTATDGPVAIPASLGGWAAVATFAAKAGGAAAKPKGKSAKAPTNCGTGHGGFRPGNVCGHKGKRAALAADIRRTRAGAKSAAEHDALRAQVRELRKHRRGHADGTLTNAHAAAARQKLRDGTVHAPPGHTPKPPKPAPAPPKPVSAAPKPIPHPDQLTHIKALGGSTGATLARDAAGGHYVVKRGKSAEHVREESHADRIYAALGVPVARHAIHETAAGPAKVAEHIQGTTLGELRKADPAAADAAEARLRKHFVADALLGNWDVVGANHDNILVGKGGVAYRVDNGGSLRFRAQGAPKAAHQWGEQVGEVDSMRHGHINPSAAAVFGKVTDAEVHAQIGAILKRKAAVLAAAPPELRETLGKRIDWLGAHKAAAEVKVKADAALAKQAAKHKAKVDAFQAANPGKPLPKALGGGPKDPAAFKDWAHDPIAGNDHVKQAFAPWAKALPAPEKAAVQNFTGNGFTDINKAIWGTKKFSAPEKAALDQQIHHLEQALTKATLHEDTAVYRGVSPAGLKAVGIHDPAALIPGTVLHMSGFKSTSIDPKIAQNFAESGGSGGAIFKILADKGTKGAYVNADNISPHPSEKEFLLPQAVSKFKVHAVEPVKSAGYSKPNYIIHVTIHHG